MLDYFLVIYCPEKPVSSSLISFAFFFFLFLDSGIQAFVTLLTKSNIRNVCVSHCDRHTSHSVSDSETPWTVAR